MNIKLNQKIIKELCGAVSFKRGEAFFRAHKVTFQEYSPARCQATVAGTEAFHVVIEREDDDHFQCSCSCPKLASFQKDCQHIAAVLLAIYDVQRKGSAQVETIAAEGELAKGLLHIFDQRPKRSSGHQLHFEDRQVLDVEFICQPILNESGHTLFSIGLAVENTRLTNIRSFLEAVGQGHSVQLYDSGRHCFKKEVDLVLQLLIQLSQDEQSIQPELLIIPPSAWKQLEPLLAKAPLVKLNYGGHTFHELTITEELPEVQFALMEADDQHYCLAVTGLADLIVAELYGLVLTAGKIIRLPADNFQRLVELKQLLDTSGTNQVFIPTGQIHHVIEKVVPGLKHLGRVELSEQLTERFMKTPLVAKLYLDRVKNRLLAGLEFHYENIIIHPLQDQNRFASARIIRDIEKEKAILKQLADSSFTQTEGGYFLHNEELEYEFLYHVVPKLQKEVQIYATTAVRNRISRPPVPPALRVNFKRERTNWLEFTFELDGIPQRHIKEVLEALEEKRKYYRLRDGSLLSLETREFQEIQRFLQEMPQARKEREERIIMSLMEGLPLLDALDDTKVFKLGESFQQFLADLHHPDRLTFTVPDRLQPILRDYQIQGYQWLKSLAYYGFGGILADEMGLGKTLQSITFIVSELAHVRESKQPILIVCPSSLLYNWLSELLKFAPEIQAVVVDGSQNERRRLQQEAAGVDVLITSYSLLRQDQQWYEKQTFHTIFFDEAQAFKNPLTQTARAVKRLRATHRFALTGTPVENFPEELWSIFHVVFPELFKGLKEFSQLTRKKISRRVRPFLLRRLKEDVVAELPEKRSFVESVDLLPEQKKLYAAYLAKLREDTLKHLDQETIRKNRIKILAGLTRLRQICCHPGLFVDGYQGSSAKLELLLKIVEEARHAGQRVLIFSQFTKMLELIGRELAMRGLSFFYLDGQTPSEERLEMCERFNDGEREFFLISLKAGGTGLNLTGADTVILYDIWWNPAVEEQAADRAHRIGQKKVVQVIKLITHGTIEAKMNELQAKKRHLIEEILDPAEKGPLTFTEEDLREILSY